MGVNSEDLILTLDEKGCKMEYKQIPESQKMVFQLWCFLWCFLL